MKGTLANNHFSFYFLVTSTKKSFIGISRGTYILFLTVYDTTNVTSTSCSTSSMVTIIRQWTALIFIFIMMMYKIVSSLNNPCINNLQEESPFQGLHLDLHGTLPCFSVSRCCHVGNCPYKAMDFFFLSNRRKCCEIKFREPSSLSSPLNITSASTCIKVKYIFFKKTCPWS